MQLMRLAPVLAVAAALLRRQADPFTDAVGDLADTVVGTERTCSCDCCVTVSPSEAVDAPEWVCSSRTPTETCADQCKLGCGSVLQATETGVVQMSRFCMADCKPTEPQDRAD